MAPRNYLLFLFFVGFLAASCDKKTPGPSQPDATPKSKILVNNPWRLTDVTTNSGTRIPKNQLGLQTQILYSLDFQFFDNNITKALDQTSRQVINGGTWYLIENDQALDIEILQFKGNFGVDGLTRAKMTLTTEVPVNGVNTPALLVFMPVIR